MGNETTLPTTADRTTALVAPSFGAKMQLRTLADAKEFAELIVKSGMAPKGMTVEGAVICMQMGYEVGLSPMQAIQNIAPINGRPTLWGDAMLGLVRASGLLEWIKEEIIGDPGTDSRGYRCTVKRVGCEPASEEFTVADAKRAGLWGKPGPWTHYPQRMLRFRTRGFTLRDNFQDVLKGLISREEAMDIPKEKNITALGEDSPSLPAKALEMFEPTTETARRESNAGDSPAVEPQAAPEPTPEQESAEDRKQAVLDAVKVPEELLAAWTKTQPPGTMLWTGGSLMQLSRAGCLHMIENAEEIRRAVNEWVDKNQEE